MAFDEVRFPETISYGSRGGPEFSTDVAVMASGAEQRNQNWSYARYRFFPLEEIKSPSQVADILSFFKARRGRARGFRFKDWSDYATTDIHSKIGTYSSVTQSLSDYKTPNGIITTFQLVKYYHYSSLATYTRLIKKPVANSSTIYLDGTPATAGQFTISTTNGIVTFTSAPATNTAITAVFEFDVPVRFAKDQLNIAVDEWQNLSIDDLELIEIRT